MGAKDEIPTALDSAREIFGGWSGIDRPARATAARAGRALTFLALGIAIGIGWKESGRGVVSVGPPPPRGGTGGESAALFAARYGELRAAELRSADSAEAALSSVPVALPVDGRLTSSFTPRRFHPILRRVRPHWGIDIAAAHGSPVAAAADGTVKDVARNPSYGLVVDISHRNGEFITRYAHLSAVLVEEGQQVRRGELIGRVGSSGLSTGPHLHYEVFVRGRRRDPALLIDPGAAAGLLP